MTRSNKSLNFYFPFKGIVLQKINFAILVLFKSRNKNFSLINHFVFFHLSNTYIIQEEEFIKIH